MNYIPPYDYDADPFGVMRVRRRQAEAARLAAEQEAQRAAGSADTRAAPDDKPPTGASPSADPPPLGEVAAAPAAGGGGSPPGAAGEAGPLHHPAAPDGPPSPEGEELVPAEIEPHERVLAWMNEHWDRVLAMAMAGEAPVHSPPPLPAPPEHPGAAGEPPPPPYVAPGDRWTKWKMAEFLRQLAATQSVSQAAKAVGMGRQSAYKLRSRLKGQPFDIAWEAAFRHGYDNLAHSALELALEGEEVPHYYKGELVATHRKRNAALIVQLLRMRNRAGAPMLGRYGAAAEFWSEGWERMTHRVETGSVTWSDEREGLGAEEMDRLALPDARHEVDRIIERNLPDEGPKGRFPR